MKKMTYLLPFLAVLASCSTNAQIPSIYYQKGDHIIGRASAIYEVDCGQSDEDSSESCAERYSPRPREFSDIVKQANSIIGPAIVQEDADGKRSVKFLLDRDSRNAVQTLLMTHADEVCTNYQFRIYGTVIGVRVGASALDQAIGLLAGVATGSLAGQVLDDLRGAFAANNGILNEDYLRASYFQTLFASVHRTKREMKAAIILAQTYPPDDKSAEKMEYSVAEALSDALTYHRICDIGYMLTSGTEMSEAKKSLFAWRFDAEFKKE